MPEDLRLVTWNLQGSKGLDVDAAAAVIRPLRPDVVAAQEVQRRQSRQLAVRCGLSHRHWTFKHWPVVSRPEGLAVLAAHRLTRASSFVVRPSWPWSWRRRVAIDATVVRAGRPHRIFDIHLSPRDEARGRLAEIAVLRERAGVAPPVVVGDLNDRPGGPAAEAIVASGWRDAWSATHAPDPIGRGGPSVDPDDDDRDDDDREDVDDDGATNWTPGERRGRRPTQRLDFVFVPADWTIVTCDVVDEPLDVLAELSDHLPVVAVLRPGAPRER